MSLTEKIPFLDLVTPHQELEPELTAVFHKVLQTAGFVGGPMVEEFEKEFAAFCDAKYCVGVASGTDAVRFALTAAGVQPGDIVVTVPHTFIATTEAISQAGARPDFVDIDEQTYSMDVASLREYLERECYVDRETGKPYHRKYRAPVTAVVPVHIYGQCADMDPILELARRYNLIVVEDACQAHGAEYFSEKENRWKKAGSMGHAAAFSFYPGKNLGACGEAGAVTTNSESMARQMRMLRDHGQSKKYYHDIEGYNGRLDSLQAGLLSVKLRHLAEWNRQRQEAAARYDQLLVNCRWRRRSASSIVVAACASSVCSASRGPHRSAEALGGREDRYRHSLSDSTAFAKSLRDFWIQARRLSCYRESRVGDSIPANVPATAGFRAIPRRPEDSRICLGRRPSLKMLCQF